MFGKKVEAAKLSPKAQAFVNSFAKIQEAINELTASDISAESILYNDITPKFSSELKSAVMKHVLAARHGCPAIVNLPAISGGNFDPRSNYEHRATTTTNGTAKAATK
jgi:hypothetical protein